MNKPLAIVLGLLAAAALSACGGSAAPGVALAPGGVTGTSAAPATAVPATDASVSTPKPPSPLASEPVIGRPAGLPPRKLVVRNLIVGKGTVAKLGDQVTVNYVGVLYKSGKVFDSSWQRKQTFTTQLSNGGVISGWVAGIVGERVGGRRELIIPPNLGYGAAGSPPKIPPNATLVFDVDLLAVAPGGDD